MRLRLLIVLTLAMLALPFAAGIAGAQAVDDQQQPAADDPDAYKFRDTVKIGVLAFRGKDWALRHWMATADYLSETVKGYQFEIVPLSLREMEFAVRQSELDFAITNSGHYVTLETRYGGSRLVTLSALGPGSSENLTGSVVFTRADRTDIKQLKDLHDKSFMSVAPDAFCYQMAWYGMQQEGIEPNKDFRNLQFAGFPQDNIVTAVEMGQADAGNVQTGVLEAMAAEGKIKLSDFRVLAPSRTEDFPYLTSTSVYPEWPFIKLKKADKALAKQVAIALLAMPSDSRAAREGEYAGWTVPLDYSPVHNMFRDLKIGPYAGLGELTLTSFFIEYKPWFIMAASLLLISILWAARTERVVQRRTAELAQANKDLADQIVQRRHAEDIARKRQAELSRVSELNSLGELASGIAHELNHPLGTIVNYATGCLRKLKSGVDCREELTDVMQRMLNQANRASELIRGMRESMGENRRARQDVDVNRLVHDVSELMEFSLRNNATVLNLELAEDLPLAHVDPVQIEQVLLNLIGNSIDALGAVDAARRRITIASSVTDANELLVSVKDTGPGISDEMADRIFHPFVSTKQEGMGLGLSISCNIIKDHGGKLWLNREAGEGTEFRFILPTRGANDLA